MPNDERDMRQSGLAALAPLILHVWSHATHQNPMLEACASRLEAIASRPMSRRSWERETFHT